MRIKQVRVCHKCGENSTVVQVNNHRSLFLPKSKNRDLLILLGPWFGFICMGKRQHQPIKHCMALCRATSPVWNLMSPNQRYTVMLSAGRETCFLKLLNCCLRYSLQVYVKPSGPHSQSLSWFCSIKQLGVHGWDASPSVSQGYPWHLLVPIYTLGQREALLE